MKVFKRLTIICAACGRITKTPPPALGELIEFLKRMKNLSNAVAAAALDDLILSNLFDGMELDQRPEGTNGLFRPY